VSLAKNNLSLPTFPPPHQNLVKVNIYTASDFCVRVSWMHYCLSQIPVMFWCCNQTDFFNGKKIRLCIQNCVIQHAISLRTHTHTHTRTHVPVRSQYLKCFIIQDHCNYYSTPHTRNLHNQSTKGFWRGAHHLSFNMTTITPTCPSTETTDRTVEFASRF
jgi:hypothetical protein